MLSYSLLCAFLLSGMLIVTVDARSDCSNNCDFCPQASNANECWKDYRERDRRCGYLASKGLRDTRFSFEAHGRRCYCCP